GKISVPDHILLKKSSLTNEEFEIIKRHPLVGYQILQHIQELEFTLDGVLYHHEAWDGSGYPLGRTGQNIPLVARLLAVVDSFDAMASSRPYRTGMSFEKAESILRDGAGTQWDPDLVSIFLQYKEEFRRICQDSATHFQSIDTIDLNALYANPHSRELNAVTKPVMAEASV
ncbi:MAG: HD domain-containing protein, partial [Planctomycetota bacterium]